MLLNILNLPQNVKYSDVKALVRATCGVEDMIMDHMIMHTARSKQVTLGLANDEDAAVVMRKLNGFYMDGYRLQVVPKSKVPSAPKADIPPLIPVWSANQPPTMVPQPLMDFGKTNSQTVPYYQLNQPSYESQSTFSSNAEMLTYPFGNNKVNRQVTWSGQNDQPTNTRESPWDQQESKWDDNRESRRDSDRDWGNNRDMEWESNNTSNHDNSRDSRRSSKRDREWEDSRGSRRDDYRESKHSRDANKTDRHSRRDSNRDSRRDGNRDSRWDSSRNSKWGSSRDSKRDGSRDSKWDGNRDSKWDGSRGSRWNDDRDSNRNSYRSNQSAASPRARGSPHNRYDQTHTRSSPGRGYGSHDSSNNRNVSRDARTYEYDNKSKRDRSAVDRRVDRAPSPEAKRARTYNFRQDEPECINLTTSEYEAYEPERISLTASELGAYEPERKSLTASELGAFQQAYNNVHQLQNPINNQGAGKKKKNDRAAVMTWRGQLASKYAKAILEDKSYEYIGVEYGKLLNELKAALRARLDSFFKFNTYNIQEMEERYRLKYLPNTDWILLRDTLAKLGGTLISPKGRKANKGKKSAPQVPVPPQYGPVFGNLKIDHRNEPKMPPQQPQIGAVPNQPNVPRRSVVSSFWTDATIQQPQGFVNQNQAHQYMPKAPPQQQSKGVVNQNQAHLYVPKAPPQQQPKGVAFQNQAHQFVPKAPPQQQPKVKKNPGSIPLAQIPGRIPQYPNGDKQQYKEQKKNTTALFTSEDYVESIMENLKPGIKQAMLEEVDKLGDVVVDVGKDPEPGEENFCQRLQAIVPNELKRMMKINMTRRLVPILPIGVRIYAMPQVKREPLENFLKQFNVSVLKRSKLKQYFVAYCQNFDDHDKLCATKTTIGASYVTFKSLHMAGIREKTTKGAILKQRKMLKKEQIAHSKMMLGLAEASTAPGEVKGEVIDEKELCQEMKQLYDEINAPDDETIDQNTENLVSQTNAGIMPENLVSQNQDIVQANNFESHLQSTATVDFTADDVVENFNDMENINDVPCLPVIEDRIGDGLQKDDDDGLQRNDDDGLHRNDDDGLHNDDDDDVQEHINEVETVDLVDDDDEVQLVNPTAQVDDIDWADVNDDELEDW